MDRPLIVVLAAAALCFSFAASADQFDIAVSKARTAQGKETLRCSPQGGDGWLSPPEAFQRLKRGSVLRLAPGEYSGEMQIDTNDVIIECDPGQDPSKMALSLRVNGDDCVLRGLRLQNLVLRQSCVLVDSVASNVSFEPNWEQKKKHKLFFGNSLIWRAGLYASEFEAVADFRYCTFYGGVPPAGDPQNLVDLGGRMNVSFSKCIFFGGNCLSVDGDGTRLSIESCVFYGINSVARAGGSGAVARDVKEIRKVCRGTVNLKGQSLVAKPDFKSPFDFSFYDPEAKEFDLSGFQLKDGSPGKELGAGVMLTLKNFPGPALADSASAKKPSAPPPATPPALPVQPPLPKPPVAKAEPAQDDAAPKAPEANASLKKLNAGGDDDQKLLDAINAPPSFP